MGGRWHSIDRGNRRRFFREDVHFVKLVSLAAIIADVAGLNLAGSQGGV
jgi:hypothetical protein